MKTLPYFLVSLCSFTTDNTAFLLFCTLSYSSKSGIRIFLYLVFNEVSRSFPFPVNFLNRISLMPKHPMPAVTYKQTPYHPWEMNWIFQANKHKQLWLWITNSLAWLYPWLGWVELSDLNLLPSRIEI